MALQLSNLTKKSAMTDAFKKSGATYYLSIPLPPAQPGATPLPNQVVVFNVTNGLAELAAPVQFAVQTGTTVDNLYISTAPPTNETSGTNIVDQITLEGAEIEVFSVAGIYLINTLKITLAERNV